MRLTILPLLLFAAACGRSEERESEALPPPLAVAPDVAVDAKRAAAPETLVGEYRVAGIDGRPLDGDVGIGISIDGETIGYEPLCANFAWTYRYQGGEIETGRRSAAEPVACDSAIAPELSRLAEALDAAERAERTPENGLRLSGEGRSVTLFTQ